MRHWLGQVSRDLRVIIHHFWPCARSGDLVLLSIIWFAVGVNTLNHDPERTVVIVELLGPYIRAALWFGAAIIAFIVATHGPGYVHGIDKWGFAALMIPVAIRALSYWVAWGIGISGIDSPYGSVALWPGAVSWTVVGIFVYRLGRRPELPREIQRGALRFNARHRNRTRPRESA